MIKKVVKEKQNIKTMFFLLVNLKTYSQLLPSKIFSIAKAMAELKKSADKHNVRLILCPPTSHLAILAKDYDFIFAQHLDPTDCGQSTGSMPAEFLKKLGSKGSLLNHSEHRIDKKLIKITLEKAKEENLEICLCAKDTKELKEFGTYKPTFLAIEPPELIGGDISVSTAQPELITKSVSIAGKENSLIVGAGIKTKKDIEVAKKLGAKGILLASGVVKAENPKELLQDLITGFYEK
ncbi:MAG: triosephosphate isomerase [Candidatus Woesearchaeota archaeon]|nr:MAG: triosephosphate isomerase [Candidatus Woesearchaeota archaeon]